MLDACPEAQNTTSMSGSSPPEGTVTSGSVSVCIFEQRKRERDKGREWEREREREGERGPCGGAEPLDIRTSATMVLY